jgi:Nitrile hydratase, alpha chain
MTTDPRDVKGFQRLEEIGAKALGDDDYRRELIDDPKSVLRREGLDVADDVEVVVHRNREKLIHLVLPAGPPEHTLHVEDVNVASLVKRHPF